MEKMMNICYNLLQLYNLTAKFVEAGGFGYTRAKQSHHHQRL